MICKKCGKYNPDYSKVCMYCGASVEEKKDNKSGSFYQGDAWNKNNQPKIVQDRTVAGYLLCLFLGIIGLVIGLACFSEPQEKESFMKAWVECFVIILIFGGIVFLICGGLIVFGVSSCF